MIRQIKTAFKYTKVHDSFINSLGVLVGHEWDTPSKGYAARSAESIRRNNGMESLKLFIRKKLENSHKQKNINSHEIHCAYCGLKLNVTSNDEIEHFSPKSQRRTPKWMFLPENLLVACHLCNGPKKKGNKVVIETSNTLYKKCTFKIVHPRIDDPDKHYSYLDKNKLFICKSKCSDKGKLSVTWFKLDSKSHTLARISEFKENSFKIDLKKGTINLDNAFEKKYFS